MIFFGDVPQFALAQLGGISAVLCTRDGRPVRLTEQQSVKAKSAVFKAQGCTVQDGELRASDDSTGRALSLPVSHCFGARNFKPKGPSADPTVSFREITDEIFLVLATSSVTKILSDVEIVGAALDGFDSVQAAAKAVVRLALSKGAPDQVGVVVVEFGWRSSRLTAFREEVKERKGGLGATAAPVDDGFDMFGGAPPAKPAEEDSFDMFG
jgi:serine/threonine protein phosphatase PrpC